MSSISIYQKKAALITFLVSVFVLFLLFFCGLQYLDPPEEYGIAINFGTSDVGAGVPRINKTIKSNPVPNSSSEEKNIPKTNTANPEEVLTQQEEDAPVLEKQKAEQKQTKVVEKKIEPIKKESVKEEIKKPVPAKETQHVLNSLFGKTASGETATSEGDTDTNGVKGSLSGNPNSNKYYGNDGLGGSGDYSLKGRRALAKPKEKPNCNEEGIVVVRIEVDVNGKVVNAVPGVKGTTNNNPCLLVPAKKAALATKWNADGNAPNRQVGLIRYKFVLSE